MSKNLRLTEVGNYVVILEHFPAGGGIMALPESWSVITARPAWTSSGQFSRFVVTRQRKKSFVTAATGFNKTVARVRLQEEKRLLATPMIVEVSHV